MKNELKCLSEFILVVKMVILGFGILVSNFW